MIKSSLNLMPERLAKRMQTKRVMKFWGIIGLIFLVALVVAMKIQRHRYENAQNKLAIADNLVEPVDFMIRSNTRRKTEIATLATSSDLNNTHRSLLTLLREVFANNVILEGRLSVDSITLEQKSDSSEVTLGGIAMAGGVIEQFLTQLRSSPLFESVQKTPPTSHSVDGIKVLRYQINCTLHR